MFAIWQPWFKACLEVNSVWKDLLTSERYITIGRRVFLDKIFVDEMNLWTAAKFHNNDEARRLLASGMVDVNCRSVKNSETLLHVAAWQGRMDFRSTFHDDFVTTYNFFRTFVEVGTSPLNMFTILQGGHSACLVKRTL